MESVSQEPQESELYRSYLRKQYEDRQQKKIEKLQRLKDVIDPDILTKIDKEYELTKIKEYKPKPLKYKTNEEYLASKRDMMRRLKEQRSAQ